MDKKLKDALVALKGIFGDIANSDLNEASTGDVLDKYGKSTALKFKAMKAKYKDDPNKSVRMVDGKPKVVTLTADEKATAKKRSQKMKGKKRVQTNKTAIQKKSAKTRKKLENYSNDDIFDISNEMDLLNDMINENTNSDVDEILASKLKEIKSILSEGNANTKAKSLDEQIKEKLNNIKKMIKG